jgi:hypothetical protein
VTTCLRSRSNRLNATAVGSPIEIEGLFTRARSATAERRAPATTHARLRGDNNAQRSPISLQWRSQALCDLRRQIWPHPLLLLANRPLFKEVRCPLQDTPGERSPLATSASSRLTCRLMSPVLPPTRIAPHRGAPHEIHPGQWQEAAPKAHLRVLFPADRSRLLARNRDAPHLLRSRLLRRTLQKRVRASRKTGNGIMSARPPIEPSPWPGSPDEHRCNRRKGHCDASL